MKRLNQIPPPSRVLLRIPVPWVFVLAYILGAGLQLLLPRGGIAPSTRQVLMIAGVALWLLAAFIAGWALWLFHRRRTTTTPGEISRVLVAGGPYRLSRNPMYVGIVLAYVGQMCVQALAAPLATLVLAVAYLQSAVIPLEESRLRETFGEAYVQYCARIRRWL
ncbi:MAG: methyltransferase family protein [Terriglobales bacterium]